MVTAETILLAQELVKGATDEELEGGYRWLFETQPEIVDCLVDLTRDHKENIRELVLFLAFVIFKAYDLENPGKTDRVSRADFATAHEQMMEWIVRLDGIPGSHQETEPYLLIYALREMTQPLQDGTILRSGEQDEVLGMVKTVILAIERACGEVRR